MTKITAKKKEKWIERLDNLKSTTNNLYFEITNCGIQDDKIDTLSNMTCWFDEAMAEIEALPESN